MTHDGYLAHRYVTLFTGLWKAGKTTLLSHLLKLTDKGGHLGTYIMPTRVLLVSEESVGLWRRRRDEIGLGDNVDLIVRPFKIRPSHEQWLEFVRDLSGRTADRHYGAVILDTFSAMSPIQHENDAGEMLTALTPLHQICEAGAAVMLVHHPRKSQGTEGQASRGSGALPGFVDIIIELRRYDPEHGADRRRVLKTYSRFDESPDEIVLELGQDGDGYEHIGSRADAGRSDRLEIIEELVPDVEPGMTAMEIREGWPPDEIPRPSKRTLLRDLEAGVSIGRFKRSGEGKRSDPFRFVTPPLPRDTKQGGRG